MPSTGQRPADVTDALIAWQETGDERSLESLIVATRTELEQFAAVSLRRRGIADHSAVDDALSLVFDHLRRLRGAAPGEHAVARFEVARIPDGRRGDAGKAYLAWLTRERACDVARQRRRLTKHVQSLADGAIRTRLYVDLHGNREDDRDCRVLFHAAIARLDPRLRTVVDLLIEGKSQAVIAHALDVCEGTVSRLRSKAIAELRRMME